MSENNLIVIYNQEVLGKEFNIYGSYEEPLFLAKDVANWIENKNVSQMLNVVDEDEKALYIMYRVDGSTHKQWFLTEDGLYEVLMQSRKPIAKTFKKEVKQILKTIRKTGCYIGSSASTESIDYQSKYGIRRIRKTFNESTDPRKTYEEYIELSKAESKAKRITSEDRIKTSKIIIDTLEQKVADNVSNMRGSELLAIQELLTDINKDLRILFNRRNGGLLAAKTKEINQLNSYFPSDDDWYLIEKGAFSENYMYESRKDKKGFAKTPAYSRWINNLNLNQYLPETYPNVDFTKPLSIWIAYGCMDKFDIVNLHKAILDQISDYYDFDDNLILEFHPILNEYVSSYSESYMFISIRNI